MELKGTNLAIGRTERNRVDIIWGLSGPVGYFVCPVCVGLGLDFDDCSARGQGPPGLVKYPDRKVAQMIREFLEEEEAGVSPKTSFP